MTGSPQLPLEILPLILDHLQWRVRDLHACSLTSKTWNHYATPRLYTRLFLRDQTRLIKVFKTLEKNDALAKLVKVLEIRVFPFGLKAEELEKLEASLLAFLLKATNLAELYWTRTGSLTDRVLPFLPILPSLETLELTGSSRFYSPSNVTKCLLASDKAPSLKHFSILLPDRQVCDELPRWARELGSKLRSFSILCQHSPIVTDSVLRDVSQHLTGITRLSIIGAKQVSCEGVFSLLRSGDVKELAIEGLAVHPSTYHRLSARLINLRSLTLTFPKHSLCLPHEFWQHLASFVEVLPFLTEFTLYRSSWNTSRFGEPDLLEDTFDGLDASTGDSHDLEHGVSETQRQVGESNAIQEGQNFIREPLLSSSFLRRLLLSNGPSLRKLRIHGIVATSEQVRAVCETCYNLQDLVLHLFESDNSSIESSLKQLPNLISLHILSPLNSAMFLSEQDLRSLAKRCSTTLRQLGFRNRVWLVDREATDGENGEEVSEELLEDGRKVVLKRWDMSAGIFPEVLLVVRD
ncbi:hypothetical protein CBS101457_001180 [Exobasidium rhododendri]|nr:hypothetical protein CBS101457_001180 [Exobasidium rhododendri]